MVIREWETTTADDGTTTRYRRIKIDKDFLRIASTARLAKALFRAIGQSIFGFDVFDSPGDRQFKLTSNTLSNEHCTRKQNGMGPTIP